eukprot:s830_g14.t1
MPSLVQPPLTAQTSCTRQLYDIWDQHATFGPAHFERFLRVETWYLEGSRPNAASSVSLLQSRVQHTKTQEERLTPRLVFHTQVPTNSDAGPVQKLDLHPAIVAFEIFDSHFLLPQLDLPDLPPEHPAYSWTTSWWDFCTLGQTIWIYYDGSSHAQADATTVTAAVAAFLEIDGQWVFACFNRSSPTRTLQKLLRRRTFCFGNQLQDGI